MRNVDAGFCALRTDERAESVAADAAEQLHIRAEPREIFAHIARHAAGRETDVAGVGIAQMHRRERRAVEIGVGRADADDIWFLLHMAASCELVKLYHSERARKSQERNCER